MKTFNITLNGLSAGDIEQAIERVKTLIDEGYTSASLTKNDTGSFTFDSRGEYETEEERLARMAKEHRVSIGTLAAEFGISKDQLSKDGGMLELIQFAVEDGTTYDAIEELILKVHGH